jgi:hypothetical protein
VILAPALVVLAIYAVILISAAQGVTQQILIGFGFGLSLAWVLTVLAGARILLLTARATSEGIQTAYPWGGQRALKWVLIDHVDRQLGFVRMHSSDGQQILLLLNGLDNGERLMRLALLRVSPTILSAPLQQELALLGGGVYRTRYTPPTPRVGLSPLWQALAGLMGLSGAGIAAWGSLMHLGALLITGVALGLVGVACLFVLRQTLTLTETDITLERGFGQPITLTWAEIKLIEYSPLQMMMALRGERRIVFIGAFFMAPNRRAHLQRAFDQHLVPHNVPVLQRWFIY